MKRLMGFFLAVMMAFGLLTGCNGNSGDDVRTTAASEERGTQKGEESTEEGKITTEVPIEEMTEAPTEEQRNKIQYPLTDAGSLTWYLGGGIDVDIEYNGDVSKSPLHNYLKVATGVDIVWRFPEWNDFYERPTLSIGTGSNVDFEGVFADGLIWDLTPYLEEYAPDYWAWLNEDETRLKKIALTTGEIVYFACGVEEEYTCSYGPLIRKDWLDECGLEIPYTLEEWETVLRTFKDRYNVAPMYMTGSDWNGLFGLASGTGAHGGLNLNLYHENGEIKCAQLQEEWKELIIILNRWYKEGLITPADGRGGSTSDKEKAASQGRVGCIFVSKAVASRVASKTAEYEMDTQQKTTAEWMAIPYAVPNKGEQPVYTKYEGMDISAGTVITTECSEEELITAIKMLNYGYTEEGKLTWNFGEQGVSWDYDEQGEIQLTDLVINDENGKSSAISKYSPMSDRVAPTIRMDRFVELKYDEFALEALNVWGANTASPLYRVDELRYTKEDAEKCVNLNSILNNFLYGFAMKCIQGEHDIVADWEFMVNELNTLGLEEYIQINQKAYDRVYKD